MARLFYTLLLYLLTPLILTRLLWRSRRAPAYARRWRERFGFVPTIPEKQYVIWVHAVSVGETLAAVPLIKSLQAKYPQTQLVVTTTTPTGSEQVSKVFGTSVYHVYAPYDLPDVLARFFLRIKPSMLIIMETELWPNLISKCRNASVPVVVANARLSEKSAAGYQKVAWLTREMLADINLIAAQTEADGERFVSLGLARDNLSISGNIKFDLDLSEPVRDQAAVFKVQWQNGADRPVWLAASTHQGEDELVLDAFAKVIEEQPNTLLVLVPRHPERFDDVASLSVTRGFSVARRSEMNSPDSDPIYRNTQVLIGDTMGELLAFCGASDLAFIGGSLVPVGGHNLIEPAAWGIPIVTGPHLFNFAEVANKLVEAGGMRICESSGQLADLVLELLNKSDQYQAMAEAAHSVAESNRGALERLVKSLSEWLE
ncbi:MAG: lipid IV(A) 3-deoxy-D-manno-octulosonic acid transferase [Porticoccaceae bacterium]|nr:lipid IV(A) 3-deoxy-D-manno-octulosonic acid transferase [Porticoccaceae bacterium]